MDNIFYRKFVGVTKILLIVLSVGYLSGCARYNARSLNSLSSDLMTTSKSKGVGVVARTFTQADCKRYLDRDVINEGYQPVQVYLQNNTAKSYSFSLNRISLPHAAPEEVAEKVHTSTAGRVAGYGAGALILWPLVIPAIVDGVMSSQANERLDNDFYSKAAKDQVVNPYSHINTLIFVPCSSYVNDFTITLIDQETNEPVLLNVTAS